MNGSDKEFDIQRYNPSMAETWNRFVSQSKNGTFLFDRGYMDYHADRFQDFSLVFYRKGKIYALLPANIKDNVLYSHQGLTYGGLIMSEHCTCTAIITLFKELNTFLSNLGIQRVVYKSTPWIYHKLPSEEDLYALFIVCKAQLISRDISSSSNPGHPIPFTESRKSGLRKAVNDGLTISRSNDIATFWNILNDNLNAKYNRKPVHTIAELQLLMSRFPENIQLYVIKKDERVIGGTVLYITPTVIHTQYISACGYGKKNGAIDLLFDYLINIEFKDTHKHFDFGKSTADNSEDLNQQLIFQKEGFGMRGLCYDTYEWKL